MTEETEECKAHSGFEARLSIVEDDTEKQWTVLDKLRNRPPIWCTAVIALLTGVIGYLINGRA